MQIRTPAQLAALLAALFAALALVACSRDAEPPAPAATPPADSATDAATEAPVLSRSPAPQGARVFFVTPRDGDVVSAPVKVEFGVEGMSISPAGQAAANSGHHHVLIDTDLPDLSMPIPADANHVHFGDGSSSTELELEPGEHTLQLLFADHLHVPHEPPVHSEPITITVE